MLTDAERKFCWYYVRSRDREEAIRLAGLTIKSLPKLFQKEEVIREIERLDALEQRDLKGAAIRGLERLAFGAAPDALRLLSQEDEAGEADKPDLFCVQEIRKIKGGGFEIRFIDRLKALEALYRLTGDTDTGNGDDLLKALERSASALGGEEDAP